MGITDEGGDPSDMGFDYSGASEDIPMLLEEKNIDYPFFARHGSREKPFTIREMTGLADMGRVTEELLNIAIDRKDNWFRQKDVCAEATAYSVVASFSAESSVLNLNLTLSPFIFEDEDGVAGFIGNWRHATQYLANQFGIEIIIDYTIGIGKTS